MILFLWVLITFLNNNYCCYASTTEVVENVYIDTLVQRYITDEQLLWTYVYTNYSTRPNPKTFNFILNKIRITYNETLKDPYLVYVTSVAYMSKFIQYMDFYNLENYVQENQNKVLSSMKAIKKNISFLNSRFGIFQQLNDAPQDPYLTFDIRYQVFSEMLEDSEASCNTWSTEMESSSQKLFMFFEILSAKLLTTYLNTQRSNMMQVINNGFEKHDSEILRSQFNDMYNNLTLAAKESIGRGSRMIWMCDKNVNDTDYVGNSQQITNFLRGYVDNEINLNNEHTCWGTCSDYQFARNYGCHTETFCYEQRKINETDPICRGQIVDCLFIEDKMEVCPSVIGRNRRYEYINYGCTPTDRSEHTSCFEEGRYYGRSRDCDTRRKTLQSFRHGLVSCDYCFCYCDEQYVDSDRHFSLRPVVSDVRSNMIVSGVAIIKRNGIFSFSITESKLISHGRVQQHEPYPKRNHVIFSDFNRSDDGIIDGVDYHTLSWHSRSVNLDTIKLPHGWVVTGLRFVVIKEHIGFEIRAAQFHFNSGTLFDINEWFSADSLDRTNVHIDRPEPNQYSDIYGAYLSVPDFRTNLFVKFRPSDPDKDAGQTTVPFIDTQWVRPRNLAPLSGISIYYKGKPGLGGFIAPAVHVYDVIPHIGNKLST